MILISASSNPAGTVLTVAGATEGDRTLRESEYETYVVSGDAHKIAEELNKRPGTRLLKAIAMDWGLVPKRFTLRDLPADAFGVRVVTPDEQRAAEGLTVEERDYIFASAFERYEIFEVIVDRYRGERMQDKADRAEKIRADLDAMVPINDDKNTDQ